MKILVYSLVGSNDIRRLIGVAEYSYFYVLQEFLPLLRRFGEVVVVKEPQVEVDRIYQECIDSGDQCIFLSFTTPHSAPRGLVCPSVVVFAWEYDTLPNESWDGDLRFNWVEGLVSIGAAITHSSYTAQAIKRSVQDDVLVASIPAPVWDLMQQVRPSMILSRPRKDFSLSYTGQCLESRWIDCQKLDLLDEERRKKKQIDARIERCHLENLQVDKAGLETAPAAEPVEMAFSGVVYTSILNPYDGRKNWQVMIEAFCSVFRDVADATLLIKVSANHLIEFSDKVMEYLRRFSPLKCRITLIHGYLADQQYGELVRGTTFYVNTSFGEGQCLPLMEFMSAGVPAIAPRTTALRDYIRYWNALLLKAHPEPAAWQHDPRQKFRASHYRVEYQSLERAFRRSYAIASQRRWRLLYHLLQLGAVYGLKQHCSMKKCANQFSDFLNRFAKRRVARGI